MRKTLDVLADAVSDARVRFEAARPAGSVDAHPVAVGWATVESERAEAELALAFGAALGPFEDAPDDLLLGARCRKAVGGPADIVIVIEPATEGRLAESLARLGEGPIVVWFALGPVPADVTSAPADGPLGSERLLLHQPRDGRHLLVLDGAPGTIAT
jgi:hypothetical protein